MILGAWCTVIEVADRDPRFRSHNAIFLPPHCDLHFAALAPDRPNDSYLAFNLFVFFLDKATIQFSGLQRVQRCCHNLVGFLLLLLRLLPLLCLVTSHLIAASHLHRFLPLGQSVSGVGHRCGQVIRHRVTLLGDCEPDFGICVLPGRHSRQRFNRWECCVS